MEKCFPVHPASILHPSINVEGAGFPLWLIKALLLACSVEECAFRCTFPNE